RGHPRGGRRRTRALGDPRHREGPRRPRGRLVPPRPRPLPLDEHAARPRGARRHMAEVTRTLAALMVIAAALAAYGGDTPSKAAPTPLEGLWQIRMERKAWRPRIVEGTLTVGRRGGGFVASARFDSMYGPDA